MNPSIMKGKMFTREWLWMHSMVPFYLMNIILLRNMIRVEMIIFMKNVIIVEMIMFMKNLPMK
ncbi:hypothetical protein AALP_AA8G028000 [Arabis alpina]|uniref:Uncharacterized protein n=1 Tax=Arabis alpina TaxID=50452 RepID=A0A087G4K9_ARAAL|nr:hypothetical protein AALP_AA8G028000 [Arabis alpina]